MTAKTIRDLKVGDTVFVVYQLRRGEKERRAEEKTVQAMPDSSTNVLTATKAGSTVRLCGSTGCITRRSSIRYATRAVAMASCSVRTPTKTTMVLMT